MKHNPLTADNQIFDKMIGGVHMFVNLIVMTSVPHCTPLHKVQSAMHLTDHCAERRPGISQSTWNKRNTIVCCSWLIVLSREWTEGEHAVKAVSTMTTNTHFTLAGAVGKRVPFHIRRLADWSYTRGHFSSYSMSPGASACSAVICLCQHDVRS